MAWRLSSMVTPIRRSSVTMYVNPAVEQTHKADLPRLTFSTSGATPILVASLAKVLLPGVGCLTMVANSLPLVRATAQHLLKCRRRANLSILEGYLNSPSSPSGERSGPTKTMSSLVARRWAMACRYSTGQRFVFKSPHLHIPEICCLT